MAHIPDGVLSTPVLVGGAVVAGVALLVALRQLRDEQIPQAAVLAAAMFVASLISVPVGPSSVHLLLNGLMGLVLGWAAVPAIFVALFLQAVFFGYGGLLVLGVNTLNMAIPALACAVLIGPLLQRAEGTHVWLLGAAAGALGVALTGLLVSMALALSDQAFMPVAQIVAVSYLPLGVVEAAVTGATVGFLRRVAPEVLQPAGAR